MRLLLATLLLVTAACTEETPPRTQPVPTCTTTADCAAGTCLNSRCVANGSVAGGQACDLDQQCRSSTCQTDSTCEFAEGEPGGPCTVTDTCDAGVSCLADICVADGSVTAGMTCSLAAQCLSGECLGTFICAAGDGESCAAADCATDTSCLVDTCIADGSVEDLGTCAEDEQCESGDCNNLVCQPGACDPTGPAGGTSFTGSADASLASDAVLAVLWMVSSGSPDYEWIFGDVSAAGGSMSINLATLPPPEAVNSYGVAIGIVIAYPAGNVINPGLFVEPNDPMLGVTYQHAIIWKADCATDLEWTGLFGPGYACGVCVPAPRGQTFDSYAPTDCSNVMFELDGPGVEFCNWT